MLRGGVCRGGVVRLEEEEEFCCSPFAIPLLRGVSALEAEDPVETALRRRVGVCEGVAWPPLAPWVGTGDLALVLLAVALLTGCLFEPGAPTGDLRMDMAIGSFDLAEESELAEPTDLAEALDLADRLDRVEALDLAD